jgi:transposase
MYGPVFHLSRVVRKHLPQARIVADRFHAVRLINPSTITSWPVGET